ncbi:MAG: DUF4249 family protein [Bacteroidetes bacterium]|nr:DUF4249 family protein [Bacteroidota bacterium]
MKKKSIYILLFVLLVGCEKKIEWKIKSVEDNRIVVEGLITNERKAHFVKLTHTVSDMNVIPEPVTGATVIIREGDSSILLLEIPAGSGVYLTDSNKKGFAGTDYELMIIVNEDTMYAIAAMIPVDPQTRLSFIPNKDSTYYRANISQHQGYEFTPAMYQIDLSWGHLPGFKNKPIDSTKAKMIIYEFNSVDVSLVLGPNKEIIWVPKGCRVTEKKYSLTDEHAEYLRSMVMEMEWRGGYFDEAAANTTTNLSEGALGFFGACSVLIDTFIVQ